MTDSTVDYYAVLGIPRQASPAEIARAYRQQLRRVHPDTRPAGDDQSASGGGQAEPDAVGDVLALLREAFAVLGDPARRADYDRRTTPAPRPPRPAPPPEPSHRQPYLTGPPDPPLRAGPVHYRPSSPPGGDRR